jgi:Uma2 family endonuclease
MDIRDSTTDDPAPLLTRRRFDVTEYHTMAEAGILGEDDRIELIDGELLEMAAVGAPHIGTVMAINRLLVMAAGERASVSVRNPVRLDRHNEPEPDIALLRPRADFYRGGQPPLLADVLLLVEVSDSTLRYDTAVKRPLYARHGIPELWIVDLAGQAVEVCRAPSEGGYASITRLGDGATIEPAGLPGVLIAVRDILGPPA